MNTTITCYDRTGQVLDDGLVQWDINVTIQVGGADTTSAPNLHFCQKGRNFAYVVPSEVKGDKLEAAIPNICLQSRYPLVVFLYYEDASGEQRSKYQFQIPIIPREQPMEYVYEENIGYEDWAQITEEAKRIVEASESLEDRIQRADEILSQMDSDVDAAQKAEQNAATHEEEAKKALSETQTLQQDVEASAESAGKDAEKARQCAEAAKVSEDASKEYDRQAGEYDASAAASAQAAEENRNAADTSAQLSADSAEKAKASEEAALISEQNSKAHEEAANESSRMARSYTEGDTDLREGEETDNAHFYYEQIRRIVEGISGTLIPMGTIPFDELKAQDAQAGYMYNISDAFTTDDTFREGAGHAYPAGTNVYYTAEGEWDCLAGAQVVSVNGKTGAVTLTPKDIGAASAVDGDLDWGLIVGDTPKGNHVSFAFNKADKAIWAAAENDRGERQWNQCLYSNGNPQPSVEKLSTPRNINGVAFDGSADINVPAVKQTVFVSGGIANAIGGVYEGTGAAFVTEYVGGLAKIDFTITTVREEPAESPMTFQWGLNRNLLASKGAPMIEPILGGRIQIFQNTGILDVGHVGFGGLVHPVPPFWVPARVYTTPDGATGFWASNITKTGWYVTGTVYGKVI